MAEQEPQPGRFRRALIAGGLSAIACAVVSPTALDEKIAYADQMCVGWYNPPYIDANCSQWVDPNTGNIIVTEYSSAPHAGELTQAKVSDGYGVVIANLTGKSQDPSFFQIVTQGSRIGAVSNLNTDQRNQTRSNPFISPLDGDGTLKVYSNARAHKIIDVQAIANPGTIDSMRNERILDTRINPVMPQPGSLIELKGKGDGIAIVNLTATNVTQEGWAQFVVNATDGEIGEVAHINAEPGQTVGKLTIMQFGPGEFNGIGYQPGKAYLYAQGGMDLVVDIMAYLNPEKFEMIDRRLLDTRTTGNKPEARSSTTLDGGMEMAGKTVALSVVATESNKAGWLQVAGENDAFGTTANVTIDGPNQTIGGMAIVKFGPTGKLQINSWESTHIVVDVIGAFSDDAITDIPDRRVLDTRPVLTT